MYETYRFVHRLREAPPSTSIHWPWDNIARGVAIKAQIKGEGFPDIEETQLQKVLSSGFMLYSQNLNNREVDTILGKEYVIESTLCYAGIN